MLKTAILYQPNNPTMTGHSTRRQSFQPRPMGFFEREKTASQTRGSCRGHEITNCGRIKPCKYMVVLSDYPCNTALCWVGYSSWPLFFVDQKNGGEHVFFEVIKKSIISWKTVRMVIVIVIVSEVDWALMGLWPKQPTRICWNATAKSSILRCEIEVLTFVFFVGDH